MERGSTRKRSSRAPIPMRGSAPPRVPAGAATLHGLQHRADTSAKVAGLAAISGIQRRARQPIQRVLAYNTALQPADINRVDVLKQGSVYRLSTVVNNAVTAQMIIKAEMFSVGEGAAAFDARHAETSALAAQILQGVPGVHRASRADLNVLTGLVANNVQGNGLADLQGTVAAVGNFPISIFKAENVNAGDSLGDIFKPRQVPGQWQAATPKAPFEAQLQRPAIHRSLGRMATFDLLVGNGDRFRADSTANFDNLDFTAAGPVGIDNVDPNAQRGGAWAGGPHLADAGAMAAYATAVVDDILAQAKLNPLNLEKIALAVAFLDGMKDAAQTLKTRRQGLWQRSMFDPSIEKRGYLQMMVGRLDQMHP